MCSSFVLSAGTTGSQQNTGILYCNNHDNLAIVKPESLCMNINQVPVDISPTGVPRKPTETNMSKQENVHSYFY